MRLPFRRWGAHLVLSGHQHVYERMEVQDPPDSPGPAAAVGAGGNLTYVINGLGGHPWVYEIHNCAEKAPGSHSRYNAAHGAMVAQADEHLTLTLTLTLTNQ